ncbi:MAG TPA: Gfo/Idh/MocA family oxidoreductase [Xanthobacteraceae bacterium]|nr:Gfo/Idh/MocA family oxidoreductase [Xanthobacteraceae bacterium]
MRVIVAGLGVQGHKRRRFASADYVAAVDPVNPEAEYRSLHDVPLDAYDAVLACIPDEPKLDLVTYCVENGKHVLVEKPLCTPRDEDIAQLERLARARRVVVYTAYNHRFEPHCVRMRDLIASGDLGAIYSCRMFYGNGTARLVRDSAWRDRGAGVIPDLGSHLLDTCLFWFGGDIDDFRVLSAHRFENLAPDHAVLSAETRVPRIELEMTLCMWRNYFTCDVLAERGTAHIESLCKWGPTTFRHRKRVLPSGRPLEVAVTLAQDDPTWALEYEHFKKLCTSRIATDLRADLQLQQALTRLAAEVST